MSADFAMSATRLAHVFALRKSNPSHITQYANIKERINKILREGCNINQYTVIPKRK